MTDLPPLATVLLGPVGALAAALYAVRVLWLRLDALERELRAEREGRLNDARATQAALLAVYQKIVVAIERLEKISGRDLPSISIAPP